MRQLLDAIKSLRCNDNAAELARSIEKDASYVNRLLWDEGKKGAKGIGPEIMDACQKAFKLPRGFWEMDMEEATYVLDAGNRHEAAPQTIGKATYRAGWPFKDIDAKRFEALTETQRIEIQGVVRSMILDFEQSAANRNAA